MAPQTPIRVEAGSTETSIIVRWASVIPSPECAGNMVTGYRLYAAKEQSGLYVLVYDGTGAPQITSAVIAGLTPGDLYDFKVSAINFNGEGARSSQSLRTYSCMRPSGVLAPMRVAAMSTLSAVTLSWQQPNATGGCRITGYALYRSDPAQSDPDNGVEVYSEVNSVQDPNIRDQPDLFQATITNFAAGSVGQVFKYVVEAFNAIGGTRSRTASYLLATPPSAPSTAP